MKDIMLTSRIFEQDDEFIYKYAKENGYLGIEWYLNLTRLTISRKASNKFFKKMEEHKDLIYAFHLPTSDVEIGYYQERYAKISLDYLMMYIDFLKPWIENLNYRPIFTLHIAANDIPEDKLDWALTKNNLKILGDHIYRSNGLLCLENLKKGCTAEPEKIVELVQYAGINVTFDTGHAASSLLVREKKMDIVEYMTILSPYIKHVHFYSYESLSKGKHVPPESWSEIKDIWTALQGMKGELRGITLELKSIVDLEQTYTILEKNS